MADSGGRFVYRVRGFGSLVDYKMVEFLRELDALFVCSWCSMVTEKKMKLLSCGHIICEECACQTSVEKCLVDGKTVSRTVEVKWQSHAFYEHRIASEKVRCVNAMLGCEYENKLEQLDYHLRHKCTFHMVPCARCRSGVPYESLLKHNLTCKIESQASSSSSAAKYLLEDFVNARKELDHALESTDSDGVHCELRKAVTSASKMFARLQAQLAMVRTSLLDGTLAPESL
ncbi:E3 ubiquitin-protein ligase NRDP1 [Rhipicephalus microplus]|uniref:E3 ubiquitin-protein ligase NRDP1 n=1 Tax=Rhipicephalus microplus TaxID=6941 RepID=UPI003F6AC84F